MHFLDPISKKMNSADSELIELLYNSEYQNLLNYSKYILYNTDYSEDVVQETFMIAVEKITYLRDSENQVGWLYRTLQNIVRNKNREIQRSNNILNKLTNSTAKLSLEKTVPFESQLLFDESYKHLVSENDWALLYERYCEGYQYKDISKRYNLSVSACKMRILRAKSVLRREITKNM